MILVNFKWDVGRMGNVEGLFVTSYKDLKEAYGKEVYLGEILGKHSEIYGALEPEDFTIVPVSQNAIIDLINNCGGNTICGYNPLDYIEEEEE